MLSHNKVQLRNRNEYIKRENVQIKTLGEDSVNCQNKAFVEASVWCLCDTSGLSIFISIFLNPFKKSCENRMPVYIRKSQVNDSHESFYDENSHKNEFMTDPDLLKDLLPLPYR